MILNLTDVSAEPLHRQIARQLVERILDKTYAIGAALPQPRLLARRQHVNVRSVERAYDLLVDDGFARRDEDVLLVAPAVAGADNCYDNRHESSSTLSAIEDFSRDVESMLDANGIRRALCQTLARELAVENICIAEIEMASGRTLVTTSMERCGEIINPQSEFVRVLQDARGPVVLTGALAAQAGDWLTGMAGGSMYALRHRGEVVGFVALALRHGGRPLTASNHHFASILISQFVAALVTARLYAEVIEKRRLDEELAMAHDIQAALMPTDIPRHADVEVVAYSMASRTIGGDYYDYIELDDDRFAVVIADAAGKGLTAALMMSQLHAMIRGALRDGRDLVASVSRVNQQLCELELDGRFATLFVAVLDRGTRVIEFVNAGHDLPAVSRSDGSTELLDTTGPLLGVMADAVYASARVTLGGGDALVMYTDGVTETTNEAGHFYERDGLIDVLRRSRYLCADEVLETMLSDLNGFAGATALHDDRTIMIIKNRARALDEAL